MEKLDTLVADHIEQRLLQPSRLDKILSSVLDRREERTEHQATHIAELRKRATEADAKLKRLYDAIENGVTDLSDLMPKDRITELKAIRDQARADTERAERIFAFLTRFHFERRPKVLTAVEMPEYCPYTSRSPR